MPGYSDHRSAPAGDDDIPIVMVAVADPIGSGFVKFLAKPGGNITGLANLAVDFGRGCFGREETVASVTIGVKPGYLSLIVDAVNDLPV